MDPEDDDYEETLTEDGEPAPGGDPMVVACASHVADLEAHQSARVTELLKLASIYSNRDQFQGAHMARDATSYNHRRALQNLTQVGLDTLVARLVDNECHITFNTDDADYGLELRAKNQEAFVAGEMYRLDAYRQLEAMGRDGGWAGDGWLHFFELDKKVCVERAFPAEMYLDLQSTLSAPPRELYRVRYVTRAYARRRWPDMVDIIAELPASEPVYTHYAEGVDLIKLVEAYHLPDREFGEHAKGWKLIFCSNVLIERKEWTRNEFPYVRFQWSPDVCGGYSVGLIEQIAPLQLEFNRIKLRKSQSIHLLAVPRVWLNAGAQFEPSFNTEVGWVYKFTGERPVTEVGLAVPPDLWNEEQRIQAAILLQCGISPFDAQQETPDRFDSRPGLREYAQLASKRHALVSKNWERAHMDCARQIIALAKSIYEEYGEYRTIGHAKEFVREIDWSEANLEDDRFRMQLAATNLLPTDPVGKRLGVQDLAQAGAFQSDPQMLWELLTGAPDIDRFVNRKLAGQKLIEKQIYMITERQTYMGPDEMQDVQQAKVLAQEAYWLIAAKTPHGKDDEKKHEKVLAMLDQYRQECEGIQQRIQQQANAQAQAAAPQAPLGAPPSDPGIPAGIPQ